MINIIAIILGYFAFSFSLSALYGLSFHILNLLGGIIEIKIVGFLLLILVFEVVYEIPTNIVMGGVITMARKRYPIIIVGILMILEILFRQYMFYMENDLAWWFIIPGITAIMHSATMMITSSALDIMSESEEIEQQAINGNWTTSEYLSGMKKARKEAKSRSMGGAFILIGAIIISFIISYFVF